MKIRWDRLITVSPKDYKCGHCGSSVSPEKAFTGNNGRTDAGAQSARIYICHKCSKPTFFDFEDKQVPGPLIGNPVKHLPNEDLEKLFDEAKSCYSISAFTSSVMVCRKLLMNISVSEGAKEGKNFAEYVNYLNDNNYIPPNGKEWVDSIRITWQFSKSQN